MTDIIPIRIHTDCKYVNADVYNQSNSKNVACSASVNVNSDFIKDTKSWNISLERATIPLFDLPLYNKSQFDPIISVTQKNSPFNSASCRVNDYLSSGNSMNDGNIYSIAHFLEGLNLAFETAILLTDPANPKTTYPKIILNNGLFEFAFARRLTANYNSTTTPDYPNFYTFSCNHDLYNVLFSGFQTFYDQNEIEQRRFSLVIDKSKLPTRKLESGLSDYFIFTQERPTISNLFAYDSLVITADIGLKSELMSSYTPDGQSMTSRIISDYSLVSVGNLRTIATILPINYRETTVLSANNISSMTISVYAKDKTGTFKQLTIPPHSHASFKLRFRKSS